VQSACAASMVGGRPDLTPQRLSSTAAYVRLLGVPARRGGDAPEVLRGKARFRAFGCAKCHRPSFVTAADALEAELAEQRVWPYTDLLLHDLGEALADHRPEGAATGREWRTPPLWSLGLVPIVHERRFLLHDGRARSFEEAIEWHGGEADASRLEYEKSSPAARAELVRFLESL